MQPDKDVNETGARQAAIHSLAIVGFVALVFLGILLAIYAARYVPIAISHLARGTETTLTTVPTTTVPFSDTVATTSEMVATSSVASATTTANHPTSSVNTQTTSGIVGYHTVTSNTYTPGAVAIPSSHIYTGLSNLVATITDVGYLDSNDNFVSTRDLTHNEQLVVKILVSNTGTNKTGEWTIHTVIPTSSKAAFVHDEQEPSLEPNGILPLTLTLTKGKLRTGDDQQIFVQADSGNDVTESNENDNEDTAKINVD